MPNYFDELRDIRNKYYGHLNLLEIEDADYTRELARLKLVIDDFTQSAPLYQQDLRDRIKQIEAIQALSSISPEDMNNLKEIILGLILKNRDMFAQIGQVNKDIDAFVKTYKKFQKSHSDKIDEIRKLSRELKKWSESIKNQKISKEEMEKIAQAVSAHLNGKLNFFQSKLQRLGIKICLNKVNTGRTRKESPALIFFTI